MTTALRDVSASEIRTLLDSVSSIKRETEEILALAMESEYLFLSCFDTVVKEARVLRMSLSRVKVQNSTARLRRGLPDRGAVAAMRKETPDQSARIACTPIS